MKDAIEGLSFAPWAPLQGLFDLCMIDIRSRCIERDLFHITENKSCILLYMCVLLPFNAWCDLSVAIRCLASE